MKKEKETVEDAYFCDICGDEIRDAHWAYGGYATAAEETEKCFICKRDTCSKCRRHISLFEEHSETICNECLKLNSEIIKDIEENNNEFYKQFAIFRKEYQEKEIAFRKKFVSASSKEEIK